MKKDIENTEDILSLVNAFYKKVVDDNVIGYIFRDTANFSFETHIPIMVSFWESLLFGTANYKGNPMLQHIELNKKNPLTAEHFKHWLFLWETTVNENFSGKLAGEAITKAKSIAGLMEYKINNKPAILKK
ncbi:MAG: group III truncated hemoglobin [Bacteroidota bacterium]